MQSHMPAVDRKEGGVCKGHRYNSQTNSLHYASTFFTSTNASRFNSTAQLRHLKGAILFSYTSQNRHTQSTNSMQYTDSIQAHFRLVTKQSYLLLQFLLFLLLTHTHHRARAGWAEESTSQRLSIRAECNKKYSTIQCS